MVKEFNAKFFQVNYKLVSEVTECCWPILTPAR